MNFMDVAFYVCIFFITVILYSDFFCWQKTITFSNRKL